MSGGTVFSARQLDFPTLGDQPRRVGRPEDQPVCLKHARGRRGSDENPSGTERYQQPQGPNFALQLPNLCRNVHGLCPLVTWCREADPEQN